MEQFIILMSVFLISTELEKKKRLLFRVFDKENRNILPILDLKGWLSQEIFIRSHYSEVEHTEGKVKSVFTDAEMRNVMDEILGKYDKDANRQIDYDEFQDMVTDADVDQLFSIY